MLFNLQIFVRFFFFSTLFYFTILYWFCHTLTWNPPRVYTSSQSWTPLPPPTPYHLSGSSPHTSPCIQHPVSCIEHRLALCFLHDSIHVSMPFSQIIPPSPSPSESKYLKGFTVNVFYMISIIWNYEAYFMIHTVCHEFLKIYSTVLKNKYISTRFRVYFMSIILSQFYVN